MTVYPPPEQWAFEDLAIPATAGNVARNMSPGAGWRWIVRSAIVTLDTDATVANRKIYIERTNGTNITGIIGQGNTAITANQIKAIGFGPGGATDVQWNYVDFAGTINDYTGINKDIIVEGAGQIRITVDGGVAGDSFSGFLSILKIKL